MTEYEALISMIWFHLAVMVLPVVGVCIYVAMDSYRNRHSRVLYHKPYLYQSYKTDEEQWSDKAA